jgi:hypothetical protein
MYSTLVSVNASSEKLCFDEQSERHVTTMNINVTTIGAFSTRCSAMVLMTVVMALMSHLTVVSDRF